MRQAICLAALFICFAMFTSCDSTQPAEIGEQVMQIEVAAGNASAFTFDVWEQYFDINNDGIPDETFPNGDLRPVPVEIVCRKARNSSGEPILSSVFTPWNYSLDISIIRAGTTQLERLTTTDALLSTFNMSNYSESFLSGMEQPGGSCLPQAICNPIGRLPATHRIVIDSTFNELLPGEDPGDQSFICPGSGGLGNARMSGTSSNPGSIPFTINVGKGDTVVVKARKNFGAPEGITLQSEPTLQGTVFLGGVQIQNLIGESVSRAEARAGISFSFTVN